jgi:hypothetical protein
LERPKELAAQHGMKGPASLTADVNRWNERPVMRWVREQYRAHRTPIAGGGGTRYGNTG